MSIEVTSPVFFTGGVIPTRHTGDGENLSPPLAWSGLPEAAREIALICDDPDAPTAEPFVHWVLYGLAAATTGLPEGIPAEANLKRPVTARQGKNSFGTIGYGGPAPPRGHGTHRYHFKLYALDAPLDLEPRRGKRDLVRAMEGHVLAEGEPMGTYSR